MPRAPKAREVSEVQEAKMSKREAKSLLPFLLSNDNNLVELAVATNDRLASLYLIIENAIKKGIMEFLMLMKGNEEKKEDDLDRAFKMLMIKKFEKELESSEKMKDMVLPLLIQNYLEAQKQRMLQECLQQKMFQAMLANQPFDYQRALQECQAMAQMSSSMLSSFLPLLSSQSLSQPTSQAQVSQVPQPQDNQIEVSQDELETI